VLQRPDTEISVQAEYPYRQWQSISAISILLVRHYDASARVPAGGAACSAMPMPQDEVPMSRSGAGARTSTLLPAAICSGDR
jgi:hypothetical protein